MIPAANHAKLQPTQHRAHRLPLSLIVSSALIVGLLAAFLVSVGLLRMESRLKGAQHLAVSNSLQAVIEDINALFSALERDLGSTCTTAQLDTLLAQHSYATAVFITDRDGKPGCRAGQLPRNMPQISGARFQGNGYSIIMSDGSETDAQRAVIISVGDTRHVLVSPTVIPLVLATLDTAWLSAPNGDAQLVHAHHELDDHQVAAAARAMNAGAPTDFLDTENFAYVRSDRVPESLFVIQSTVLLTDWLARVLHILALSALIIGGLTGMLIWFAQKR